MWENQVRSLGWEDPLEKEMTIHSGTLAWKIPWTEEPGSHSPWGCKELDMTEQELDFTSHLLTWEVHLSVSCLFAFPYSSWGSQGKNTEVVCHSLVQ